MKGAFTPMTKCALRRTTAGVSPAKSRLKIKIGGCGIRRWTAQAAVMRTHECFAGETPAVPGAGRRAA
jgi:hypothetical protein